MPASEDSERRRHRTLPMWPFVAAVPPLLLLGVLGSMWLPTLAERAAYDRLSRLPDVTVSRAMVTSGQWPWLPVNRFTDWVHRLHPPQAAVWRVKLGPRFPRDEFARLGAMRRIVHLDASGVPLIDSDLALLSRGSVRGVLILNDTAITDAGLVHLHRQPVQTLSLLNTRVSDAGVPTLAGVSNLNRLDLTGTSVTGRGFSRLSGLPHLTTLVFGRTPVDDTGLAEIVLCKNVRSLDLYATRVTDAGIGALAGLPHLESLSLDRTTVGDAGLAAYEAARGGHHWPWRRLSLRHTRVTGPGLMSTKIETGFLHLTGTTVGDEAASWLATRRSMRELELNGTLLTDAGLTELAQSPELVSVWLKGCRITDVGAIRFLASRGRGPGNAGAITSRHGRGVEQPFLPGMGTVDALGNTRPGLPYPPAIAEALFQFQGTGRLER